jgi:hypothetical protein
MLQRLARMASARAQVQHDLRLQLDDVQSLEEAVTNFRLDDCRLVVGARRLIEGAADVSGG